MDPIIETRAFTVQLHVVQASLAFEFPERKTRVPFGHPNHLDQGIRLGELVRDERYWQGCECAHRACDCENSMKEFRDQLVTSGVIDELTIGPTTVYTLQGHQSNRCIHEFLIPETPSATFLIHGKKSPELALCYRGEYGVLACCHALWGEDSGETFVARIWDDVGYEKTLALLIYRIAMDYPFMTGAGTLFTPVPVWVPFEGTAWDVLLAKVQKHLEPLSPAFGRDTFLLTEDGCDYLQVNDLSMPGWCEPD